MARNRILIVMIVLSFSLFGVGLVLLYTIEDNFLSLTLISMGSVILVGLMVYMSVKKIKVKPLIEYEKPVEEPKHNIKATFNAYDRRLQRAQKIALEKKDDLSMLKASSVDSYFGKLEKDDVCMVCKLPLKKDDDILQCPRCESLFHKDHLLEWIRIEKKCPVCSQKFDKKQGEK